jgi:hypothetical protein
MFPRAAVSRHPVNKLGKLDWFSPLLQAVSRLDAFFRAPESAGRNKEGRRRAGLLQSEVKADQ